VTVTRTHFAFRIDMWDASGESIVEHIAGVEDYQSRRRPTGPRSSAGRARPSRCAKARESSKTAGADHVRRLGSDKGPRGAVSRES
jgi:hypothetical protein